MHGVESNSFILWCICKGIICAEVKAVCMIAAAYNYSTLQKIVMIHTELLAYFSEVTLWSEYLCPAVGLSLSQFVPVTFHRIHLLQK